jgi:hypothetical protein
MSENVRQRVSEALAALAKKETGHQDAGLDIVRDSLKEIVALREQGHDFQAIAAAMRSAGLEIKPSTLDQYVRRLKRRVIVSTPIANTVGLAPPVRSGAPRSRPVAGSTLVVSRPSEDDA